MIFVKINICECVQSAISVSKSDLHFYVYLYLKITFLLCWDYLYSIENSSVSHAFHSIRCEDQGNQAIYVMRYSKVLNSRHINSKSSTKCIEVCAICMRIYLPNDSMGFRLDGRRVRRAEAEEKKNNTTPEKYLCKWCCFFQRIMLKWFLQFCWRSDFIRAVWCFQYTCSLKTATRREKNCEYNDAIRTT